MEIKIELYHSMRKGAALNLVEKLQEWTAFSVQQNVLDGENMSHISMADLDLTGDSQRNRH